MITQDKEVAQAGRESEPPVIELIDAAVASLNEPETIALEGINWIVRPRDFWAIGGLLGSGKTDFMMMRNRPHSTR